MNNIKDGLKKCCELMLFDEALSKHTSFKIGGKADYFALPQNSVEISNLVEFAQSNNLEYFILGKGSDLLVSDEGFRGLIISTSKLNSIKLGEHDTLVVGAGASMRDISDFALKNELAGFEFASGIPGSIGGAVFMNAGAYDGELKDILDSVLVISKTGEILDLKVDELDLGYRHSNIKEKELVVFNVVLKLHKSEYAQIKAKIDDLDLKRSSKQPLEYPSAGSTFKRPVGHFAGKLISDAGLQGFSIGDAQVSTKHAGFVINKGNASAKEVYTLIKHIIKVVDEKFSVKLEPEVKFLGEF